MSDKIYLFFVVNSVKQCMVIPGWTFPSMRFQFENCVDVLNVDFGSVISWTVGMGGQRL